MQVELMRDNFADHKNDYIKTKHEDTVKRLKLVEEELKKKKLS